MGAGQSASATGTNNNGVKTGTIQHFQVKPLRNLSNFPEDLTLSISSEVLYLKHTQTDHCLATWPFHKIICWGYTAYTFQWKAHTAVMLDEYDVPSDIDTSAELSRSGEIDYELDRDIVTFSVSTELNLGELINNVLMDTVQDLMSTMDAQGVPPNVFSSMINTLFTLHEDGFGEHALVAFKQMSLGRAFDSKQATELINMLGEISPFEKVEGAVLLYPNSLLYPESFPSILEEAFQDPHERENVTHRLGIQISESGKIIPLKGASKLRT